MIFGRVQTQKRNSSLTENTSHDSQYLVQVAHLQLPFSIVNVAFTVPYSHTGTASFLSVSWTINSGLVELTLLSYSDV